MSRLAVVLLSAAVLVGACASSPASTLSGAAVVVASPSATAAAASSASAPSGSPASSEAAASFPPAPSGTPEVSPVSSPSIAPHFTLTSTAFHPGGAIPTQYSCDGKDVSPALAWDGVPDGTKSLALLVDDPDAHDFAHWIVYAMPADTVKLDQGAGSSASMSLAQGTNDFGRVGYGGPCPPSGTHHYRFTLYALAEALGLSGAPRAAAVRSALAKGHVLGTATLTGTFAR